MHSLSNIFTGLVLVIGTLIQLKVGLAVWLLVPLWAVCGLFIYTSMLVVAAALSFRVMGPYQNHYNLVLTLMNATRYPLGIYPGWLKLLLLVVIPYATFNYLPANWAFGKMPWAWLA